MNTITSKQTPWQSKLAKTTTFQQLVREHGCVQVVSPQQLQETMQTWERTFQNIQFFPAYKAIRSPALLRTIKKQGWGIDVSSQGELEQALKEGFENISCSGAKSNKYLEQAVQHNCLICVDNFSELQRIQQPARILLRIANPEYSEHTDIAKKTRFGIDKKELPAIRTYLKEHPYLSHTGYQFHGDGYTPEMKAKIIEFFLQEILLDTQERFTPEIINIGGGIPVLKHENAQEIQERVVSLQRGEYNSFLTPEKKQEYEKLLRKELTKKQPQDYIQEILHTQSSQGVSIQQLLKECQVQLMMEPGYSLFWNTGCSGFHVIETKKIEENYVIVEGTMFSMSSRMFEHIFDPQLLSNQKQELYEAYIIGILCREDDYLQGRKISFPQQPKTGDILFYFNTGAYAHYETTESQQQQKPAYYYLSEKGELKHDL